MLRQQLEWLQSVHLTACDTWWTLSSRGEFGYLSKLYCLRHLMGSACSVTKFISAEIFFEKPTYKLSAIVTL